MTVQDVRNRFAASCSHLLTASPIVSFSPTAMTSAELTNNRSAAALFKDSPVCVSLPLPANPAKQKRPATSNVDRGLAPGPAQGPGDARTGPGGGAAGSGKDSSTRGRPKTAAATSVAFFKPPGKLVLTLLTIRLALPFSHIYIPSFNIFLFRFSLMKQMPFCHLSRYAQ